MGMRLSEEVGEERGIKRKEVETYLISPQISSAWQYLMRETKAICAGYLDLMTRRSPWLSAIQFLLLMGLMTLPSNTDYRSVEIRPTPSSDPSNVNPMEPPIHSIQLHSFNFHPRR